MSLLRSQDLSCGLRLSPLLSFLSMLTLDFVSLPPPPLPFLLLLFLPLRCCVSASLYRISDVLSMLQVPEKTIVKKKVVGINTRFAVSNPFDPRYKLYVFCLKSAVCVCR